MREIKQEVLLVILRDEYLLEEALDSAVQVGSIMRATRDNLTITMCFHIGC